MVTSPHVDCLSAVDEVATSNPAFAGSMHVGSHPPTQIVPGDVWITNRVVVTGWSSVVTGRCVQVLPDGRSCRAWPVRESRFCFSQDPAKADEVADAQRLGGQRRRRERTLAVVYEFSGLGTIETIRRLLEIAATDTLGLETSIAKVRALVAVAQASAKLSRRASCPDG
jgi:hypothetical protein